MCKQLIAILITTLIASCNYLDDSSEQLNVNAFDSEQAKKFEQEQIQKRIQDYKDTITAPNVFALSKTEINEILNINNLDEIYAKYTELRTIKFACLNEYKSYKYKLIDMKEAKNLRGDIFIKATIYAPQYTTAEDRAKVTVKAGKDIFKSLLSSQPAPGYFNPNIKVYLTPSPKIIYDRIYLSIYYFNFDSQPSVQAGNNIPTNMQIKVLEELYNPNPPKKVKDQFGRINQYKLREYIASKLKISIDDIEKYDDSFHAGTISTSFLIPHTNLINQ